MIGIHVFVKHTITEVEVLEGIEGEPIVVVDPGKQQLAEEDAVYGCQICDLPLSEAFGIPCPGQPVELNDEG